jgi:hypothetical protein
MLQKLMLFETFPYVDRSRVSRQGCGKSGATCMAAVNGMMDETCAKAAPQQQVADLVWRKQQSVSQVVQRPDNPRAAGAWYVDQHDCMSTCPNLRRIDLTTQRNFCIAADASSQQQWLRAWLASGERCGSKQMLGYVR